MTGDRYTAAEPLSQIQPRRPVPGTPLGCFRLRADGKIFKTVHLKSTGTGRHLPLQGSKGFHKGRIL
jgi:hypothetical protein